MDESVYTKKVEYWLKNPKMLVADLRSYPDFYKLFRDFITENDEWFKKIKSWIYESLDKIESTKEKCDFLRNRIKTFTDWKTKNAADINENWTAEQKIGDISSMQMKHENLLAFCNDLLDTYTKLELKQTKNGFYTFDDRDLRDYINARKLVSFLRIEQNLFSNNFLAVSNGKWIETKPKLVAFIYFLIKLNHINEIIPTKTKKDKKTLLRLFFQKRYKINISQEIQPSRFDPNKDLTKAEPYFLLIFDEVDIK